MRKRLAPVLATGLAAASLLSISLLATAAPASALSCPIDVASYGRNSAAVLKAFKAMTSSCRTIVFSAGEYAISEQVKVYMDNVEVVGKNATLRPTPGTNIRGGLVQVTGDGVTVRGLTIVDSTDKGIEVGSGTTDFTIADNVIRRSHTLGIHILRARNGTVSGNTSAWNRSNGIDLHGAHDTVVTGNRTANNGATRFPDKNEGDGILVYCSQYITVRGNTSLNNAQEQPGKRDGIRVTDNDGQNGEMRTKHVVVEDNVVFDDQPSATQGWGVRIGSGVENSNITNITVRNNQGWGNINPGVHTKGLKDGGGSVIGPNNLLGR